MSSTQTILALDSTKFQDKTISDKTAKLNEHLIEVGKKTPTWWEVGPEKYREMRENGETAFPKPVTLDRGGSLMIPSRDKGRELRLRVHEPEKGQAKGVFLHIHGGGWVLQDENGQDPLLTFIADTAGLTVVSLGYRRAPEHPYPAATNDCFDTAEWLVDNAKGHFGADLAFIGGESAGGHLSLVTHLHLLTTRPAFEFKGLVLMYGVFEVSQFLPKAHHFDKPLILTRESMRRFVDAFLPGMDADALRQPEVSPFYADLHAMAAKTPSGKLPPALFSVGTWDVLMDDSIFMATKWLMAASEAVLNVYPGAPHGFTLFPPEVSEASAEFRQDLMRFLGRHL